MRIWFKILATNSYISNNIRSALYAGALLFFSLGIIVIPFGCNQPGETPSKSLIFDLEEGMPQDTVWKHIKTYALKGEIHSSKTFLPYEFQFKINGQIGEMSFLPKFDEQGKLNAIEFEMCYKAWAPWNKDLFSDKVIKGLEIENNLWPNIDFRQRKSSWTASFNGATIEATMRDEKYIRGNISY